MKINTLSLEKQIEALVPKKAYTNCNVKVTYNPTNQCGSVTVSQEYDYVDFDFEFLENLSKLFKTKRINVGSRYARRGFETCDHGSSYELTFEIYEIGSMK